MNNFGCKIVFVLLTVASAHALLVEPYFEEGHHRSRRSTEGCIQARSCLSPFAMLVDFVENDQPGALAIFKYILDENCGKKNELQQCIASAPACDSNSDNSLVQGVSRVLDYICEEGKNALASEEGCFTQDVFQIRVAQCSFATNLDIKYVALAYQTGQGKVGQMCGVFQDYLDCVYRQAKGICSTTAAVFTRDLYQHYLEFASEKFQCTYTFK